MAKINWSKCRKYPQYKPSPLVGKVDEYKTTHRKEFLSSLENKVQTYTGWALGNRKNVVMLANGRFINGKHHNKDIFYVKEKDTKYFCWYIKELFPKCIRDTIGEEVVKFLTTDYKKKDDKPFF